MKEQVKGGEGLAGNEVTFLRASPSPDQWVEAALPGWPSGSGCAR